MSTVFRLRNNRIFTASLTIFLASVGVYLYPARLAGEVPLRADTHQVGALREERLTTLRKIVNLVEQRRRKGSASMVDLVWAKRNVAEAELEICATQKERVMVLERIVEEARILESQAAQLAQNNAASEEVAWAMKADLLQSRIRLELARAELDVNACETK